MESLNGNSSRLCRWICQLKVLLPILVITIFVVIYFPYKYQNYKFKEDRIQHYLKDHQGFQNVIRNASHMLVTAYFDRRYKAPLVHILGFKRTDETSYLYCKFIYSEYEMRCSVKPAEVKVLDMRQKGEYREYIFTCTLPPLGSKVPMGVTLTDKYRHCTLSIESSQVLYIHDPQSLENNPPKGIGVCISAPGYDLTNLDHAQRVVETVVLNKAMGADYVEFHNESMTPDLLPVLQKFLDDGTLGIVSWNSRTTSVHMYAQTLAMNDCLYKNMYRFKYLIFTDIDELLVPSFANLAKDARSKWQRLFDFLESQKSSSQPIGKFIFPTREYYEHKDLYLTDRRFSEDLSCELRSKTDLEDAILPQSIRYRMKARTPDPMNTYTRFAVNPLAIGTVTIRNVGYMLQGYDKVTSLEEQAAVRHFRSSDNPLTYIDLVEDFQLDEFVPQLVKALQDTVGFPTNCLPTTPMKGS